jgi:hypothetical protein
MEFVQNVFVAINGFGNSIELRECFSPRFAHAAAVERNRTEKVDCLASATTFNYTIAMSLLFGLMPGIDASPVFSE